MAKYIALIGFVLHMGSCQIDLFNFKTIPRRKSSYISTNILSVRSLVDCVDACVAHVQCRCTDFRGSRCHLHTSADACDDGAMVTESGWRHFYLSSSHLDTCPLPAFDGVTYTDCIEGTTIDHTTSCNLTCGSNLRPSLPSISCSDFETRDLEVTCIATCPMLIITSGSYSDCTDGATVDEGTTCSYTCDPQYRQRWASVSCVGAGVWDAEPECIATCTLPSVANGGYNVYSAGETVDEDTDCQVTCDPDYRPVAHFITCIGPESLDLQPSCIGTCLVPTLSNGRYADCTAQETLDVGGQCTVSCDTNYRSLVSTVTCDGAASWDHVPQCIGTCSVPSLSNGGYADCTEHNTVDVGTQCAVSCDSDYRSLVSTVTCDGAASWDQVPQCIGTCDLPLIDNGAYYNCVEGTTIDSAWSCTVACDSGFQASVTEVTCVNTALDAEPSCTGTVCSGDELVCGGGSSPIIPVTPSSSVFGSSGDYICLDDQGWGPSTSDSSPYFEVDLESVQSVTSIQTRGSPGQDMWTRSYSVQVSNDGSTWDHVRGNDGLVSTFAANTDRDTLVSNDMPDGLTARYVRVNILDFHSSGFYNIPVLRLGVIGGC